MSKRRGLASKLFAVLGGAGLAIGICVPRANAQVPPFSNANYANRYVCNVHADFDFVGAVMKINPNGSGGFTAGTMNAAISPFAAFNPAGTAPTNFCSYTLDAPASSYAVSQQGIGTEVLSWTANSTNNTSCPESSPAGGNFLMYNKFVLRNNVTANNTVPRSDITSGNLLDDGETGRGYCLK